MKTNPTRRREPPRRRLRPIDMVRPVSAFRPNKPKPSACILAEQTQTIQARISAGTVQELVLGQHKSNRHNDFMPLSRCPAGVDAGRWDERRHRSEKFYRTRSMWYGMLRGSREPYMHDDENLTTERPTFVTHLECSATGERYPADVLHNLSRAGKPLLVRYDLAAARKALSKEALAQPAARSLALSRAASGAPRARHREPRRSRHAIGGDAQARRGAGRGRRF